MPPKRPVEWVDESEDIFHRGKGDPKSVTLQFVTETGHKRQKNVATQNLIRSHARRNPVKAGKSAPRRDNTATELEEVPRDQNWRIATIQRRAPVRTSLSRGPEVEVLDPFDTLAVGKTMHVEHLINHYDTTFASTNMAVSPKKKWLGYAISDTALLHATVLHAALHVSQLKGVAPGQDVFFHNTMAIRAINHQLNDPSLIPSDATICAIACLANFESMNGSPEGSKAHIDGLEVLVSRRGGLGQLGMDGLCRRILSWADIASSVRLETIPRFLPAQTSTDRTFVATDFPNTLNGSYSRPFLELCGSSGYTTALVQSYLDLHSATELMEKTRNKDAKTNGGIFLSDLVEDVERQMVMLLQVDKTGELEPGWKYVKIFAYSGLLHVSIALHELPISLLFLDILSQKLQRLLEDQDLQMLQARIPKVLLWALLMGGLAAATAEGRNWYVMRIAALGWSIGWRGDAALEEALGDFMWSKKYRKADCAKFWNELAMAAWR